MFHKEENKTYQHLTESRVIIRFQDCDPLQHLNNAKYLDYFFNAREDQISKLYDFKFSEVFFNYKTSWVVFQSRLAYVRPALVSEWVRIYSRLIYVADDTIVTEYFMTNDEKTQLKTIFWVTSKYVDVQTGKKVPHQTDVQYYLETIKAPNLDFPTMDFDRRVKEIKLELANENSSLA